MWVARFKVWHAGSIMLDKTRGVDAWFATYYLNAFEHEGATYVNRVSIIEGKEKQRLLEAILADPRIHVSKVEGQQVFYSHKANLAFHPIFLDKTVFFVKPVIVKDGFEYWEAASWEKENLLALFKRVKALEKKTRRG